MTIDTQIFLTNKSRVQGLRTRAGIVSLLARPESNPKLAKGRKLGVMSAPLHLAPADLSGYEVCAKRTEGCTEACVHFAGNPAHMEGKTRARIARTKLYFEDRAFFMSALISEIAALESKAQRADMICGVRLNATSDIPFERVKIKHLGKTYSNIMELFPDVQFYDYTKRPNRRNLPSNYHLTFSMAEDNDADALQALKNGFNVAAVFRTKRGQTLPKVFMNRPVIDGDLHDYRPLDESGVIVGLRAKGQAMSDKSGFVRAG